MVTTRTTDNHPIHKTPQLLNHHLLLVGFLGMSEWIIPVRRPHHWQQLKDNSDRKGGGTMRGDRWRINSKNTPPKSCRQHGNEVKGKQQDLGQSWSSDGRQLYRTRTVVPSSNGTLNPNRNAIQLLVIRRHPRLWSRAVSMKFCGLSAVTQSYSVVNPTKSNLAFYNQSDTNVTFFHHLSSLYPTPSYPPTTSVLSPNL